MIFTNYIKWDDSVNNTGISIIDEQHRAIVSTINSLFYFIQTEQSKPMILPILNMIDQYTAIHFSTEENILEQSGYAHLTEHKKYHSALIAKMKEINKSHSGGDDPTDLLKFLRDWWMNHIMQKDMDYVKHIVEKIKPTNP